MHFWYCSEQLHKCLACDVSVLGLEQYKEHIATREHTFSLYKLHNKRKGQRYPQVNYNIDLTDEEFIALQIERKKYVYLIYIQLCNTSFWF